MDFKSTCILIAFIAIGGGIVMGWKEFQDGKSGSGATATVTGQKPPENAGNEPLVTTREPPPREPDPVEPATPTPVTPRVNVPEPINLSVSAAEEAQLEEIASLIEKHKLPDANRAARQLVETRDGMVREKARQLEARIRLLQKMEPREVGKAPALKEVVLANKNVQTCTAVEESLDNYRLNLISGGITSIRKQDVIEVRTVAPREGKRLLLARLDKRVKSLKDPLDFYLRGVRKYYRLGLVDEGYGLLRELIEREDADLALSVLGEEEAAGLMPYWNISQGSGIAAIERKAYARNQEIAAIEATPEPVVTQSPEPLNPPSAAPQPPPARQPPRNPPAQPVRRPERPASKSDLLEVKELISRAGNYYSIARRDERKRGNYKKAYDTLRNAQKLLGRMTPTDEVRKMRSRVATQMLDVSKSLGFFDF